jgi:hypothetical protein
MLEDAGYLNEKDAAWDNRKRERQGKEPVSPLYTQEEARLGCMPSARIDLTRHGRRESRRDRRQGGGNEARAALHKKRPVTRWLPP